MPAAQLRGSLAWYGAIVQALAARAVDRRGPLAALAAAQGPAAARREWERCRESPAGAAVRAGVVVDPADGVAAAWEPDVSDGLVEVARHLVALPSDALAVDPLKHLYESLVPGVVRHERGEHHTPDWLAAHLLDQVGYSGDPAERVLDPACGTGTFLVQAAVRRRRALREAGAGETPGAVLEGLVGIDVAPLAVMSARAACFGAVADLLEAGHGEEVPPVDVRLGDAVVPDGDGAIGGGVAGRFELVVGNPPWVFWNTLPEPYRQLVRAEMLRYGLVKPGADRMQRLGQAGKDLATLFVYACMDRHVAEGGRLGFVITQSVFQSTAAAEFRRFELPGGRPFAVGPVHDMVDLAPFVTATTRTATFVARPGSPTSYPVEYVRWRNDGDGGLVAEATQARPAVSRRGAPWLVGDVPAVSAPADPSTHRPRKGVQTGAEGVYRVRLLGTVDSGLVRVVNDPSRAKRAVPAREGLVSAALVYPFTSGARTRRWVCDVAGHYVVPHTAETGMAPIPEGRMAGRHAETLAFLGLFREALERRAIHRRWGDRHPFYSVYNVGPYTFAPVKVVWRRVSTRFAAAVVGHTDDPVLGRRLLLPNESLMAIECGDEPEAWFAAGVLNSAPARARIDGAVAMQVHSEVLEIAGLPRYEPSRALHAEIAELAARCGAAAGAGDAATLGAAERALDATCLALWERAPR